MKRSESDTMRADIEAILEASASKGSIFDPNFFTPDAPAENPWFDWVSPGIHNVGRRLSLPDSYTEAGAERSRRVIEQLQYLTTTLAVNELDLPRHSFQQLCSVATQACAEFLLEDESNCLDLFDKRPLFEGTNESPPGRNRVDLFVLVEQTAEEINFETDSEFRDAELGAACSMVIKILDGSYDRAAIPT